MCQQDNLVDGADSGGLANRVKSKKLFNFQPAGKIDADILEGEKAMIGQMVFPDMSPLDMSAMVEKMQALSDEEYAIAVNGTMEKMQIMLNNHVFFEVVNIMSIDALYKV